MVIILSSFSLNILSFGSLFHFSELGPGYPRLQKLPGVGRPHSWGLPAPSPRASREKEGKRAPTCCPLHAWPRLLSPHTSFVLPLLEAGPEVGKLDLSSSGQWLLPCSQGTQGLAEPYSQELGTPSHPSHQNPL